jgi:type II secretion system protein G
MRIGLNKKGFTLIELLIVVAIIGIIAAIAIPNLLNAIQRGKQKRTMADMRSIATAIEAFSVDNNRYPAGGSPLSDIRSSVEPRYIKKLPTVDAWNTPYDYIAGPTSATAQQYTIASCGKDGGGSGATCTPDLTYSGSTTNFNNDLVFSQGSFIAFPEGSQE